MRANRRAFARVWDDKTDTARLLRVHDSLSAELRLAGILADPPERPSQQIRWCVFELHDIEDALAERGARPRRPWFGGR